MQQRSRHNHLDLVYSKESSGTSMSAVAKRQARRSNADELTVGDNFGGLDGRLLLVFRHPEVIVAESIKFEGLIVDLVIKVHAACGNLDDDPFWDGLTV